MKERIFFLFEFRCSKWFLSLIFFGYQSKQFRITHKFEVGIGEHSASILFVEKNWGKGKKKSVGGLIYLFTYQPQKLIQKGHKLTGY